MRRLELRRHAPREPADDAISAAGRALAEDIGRTSGRTYSMVFVSPARRAAETAAWILRGAGQQLPDHSVIPGLAGQDASGGSPEGMAAEIRALLDRLPDAATGLAVSHTPLVERAAFGLTGREVGPMAPGEGILVTEGDDGTISVEELRLGIRGRVTWSEHVLPAFLLGMALGAAPGPVQLLILSETTKGGLVQGFRVMLGANGALLAALVILALGFSTTEPSQAVIDVLRVVGGAFLLFLAVSELRTIARHRIDPAAVDAARRGSRLGPTARGVLLVIVNPGAWIFFATTASAVMAEASADAGRDAAILTAVAMTLGVSLTDLASSLVGTGSRAVFGERGLIGVRTGLCLVLLAIGAAFVLQGLGAL